MADTTATRRAGDVYDISEADREAFGRKGYVAFIVACRSLATVRAERELGFTHSHNDDRRVLDSVLGLRVVDHRPGDASRG